MNCKKSPETLYNECLRINIISLYDGYESSIVYLAQRFNVPVSQVKRYIKEEEEEEILKTLG